MTAVSDSARRVGSVCGTSVTAWGAVCALLDHAEGLGLQSSPWSNGARYDGAERVRKALEQALAAVNGAVDPAPYNSAIVKTRVRGIETSSGERELLDEGELLAYT